MAPPEAPLQKTDGPPAVPFCVDVMKTRAEFLETARGRRQATPGFVLQAKAGQGDRVTVGFTCSKKVGNAVARNRAKRRLREVARQVLPHHGRPGWRYVLIGRKGETADRNLMTLCADLKRALIRVNGS